MHAPTMLKSMTNSSEQELPEKKQIRRRIITSELRLRNYWLIRLRWWVPPSIILGAFFANRLGFEFLSYAPILLAGFILNYNLAFFMIARPEHEVTDDEVNLIRRFAAMQVVLDYIAMFLLVHFTGGAASPFIFFAFFHVIFASILLPRKNAFLLAGLVGAGMTLLASFEYLEWIPRHPIVYNGHAIDLPMQPPHLLVELIFFVASVVVTAFVATTIMGQLRRKIVSLQARQM